MSRAIGTAFGALFVGTVLVANWATSTFGFVPVGFGQAATAGTFAAGFALAARDVVQDQLGKRWMLALLAAAALLSYLVADPHNPGDCYEPTGLDEFHPDTTRNPDA
ncbi:hypothetical protein [Mycobacterium phage LOCV1]|nr:hypothetical protein [Mycobacterium phage LOCV1]WDW19749.1 hypothetical protein [Mycobacterium phage LOCV2]WDW19820.1 hypothetical protein [Mycobacterium phage LOCV3]WDW19890.1 hypothetical protein [Mycobacterium phage LOCV4]WDW19957.1 hypothetical protein [Mycobacterium phage LOCV5]WDW20121.1 hypothetical protein [Mycobacterium phage Nix22]